MSISKTITEVFPPVISDEQITNIKALTNRWTTWAARMEHLNEITHRYMQAYLRAADENPTYSSQEHPHLAMEDDLFFLKELIDTAKESPVIG
jgi:hypothetical protein